MVIVSAGMGGISAGFACDGIGAGLACDGIGAGLACDGIGAGLACDGIGIGMGEEGTGVRAFGTTFFAAGFLAESLLALVFLFTTGFGGDGMVMPGMFMDCADTGTAGVSANALAAR